MGLENTKMRYPIVIHKDEGSCYGVTVPDLPGCFSAGYTLDETFQMAREAIEGHIETMLMDEEPIPMQLPLQTHLSNKDYADGIWAIVEIDLTKLRIETRKIELELPHPVLDMIDQFAARAGETRSGFIAQAALRHASAQLEEQLAD